MLLISRLDDTGKRTVVDLPNKTFNLQYSKNKVEEVDDVTTFLKNKEDKGLFFDSFILGKLQGFKPMIGFTNYVSNVYIELGEFVDINKNKYYYRNTSRIGYLHDINVNGLTNLLDYLHRSVIFYDTIEDVEKDLNFHVKVNNMNEEARDNIIGVLSSDTCSTTEKTLFGEKVLCATPNHYKIDQEIGYTARGDYPFKQYTPPHIPVVSASPFD